MDVTIDGGGTSFSFPDTLADTHIWTLPRNYAAVITGNLVVGHHVYWHVDNTAGFAFTWPTQYVNAPTVGTVYESAEFVNVSTTVARCIAASPIPCANGTGAVVGTSVTGATYSTATNCAAAGTAANPSVAACGSASAGSFSCDPASSTGTCKVNTTAVTANSEIFIQQRSDTVTGTRLSVTCNTGITTAIPDITAVVAATSFTINVGTIVANPECFSYYVIN